MNGYPDWNPQQGQGYQMPQFGGFSPVNLPQVSQKQRQQYGQQLSGLVQAIMELRKKLAAGRLGTNMPNAEPPSDMSPLMSDPSSYGPASQYYGLPSSQLPGGY